MNKSACIIKNTRCVSLITALFLLISLLPIFGFFYPYMDANSRWVSIGAVIFFVILAKFWTEFGLLTAFACLLYALSFWLYDGSLENADQRFLLKYFLSSPAAFLWMSFLFFLSFSSYFLFLFYARKSISAFAKKLCQSGIVFGIGGMLIRWQESYLISADMGHIPVASFFEVMIWLVICCGFLFLFFDRRYELKAFGLVILGFMVAILTGLFLDSQASTQIQPLIPALQSAWMKLHVPTSFIGYAGFGLAAACGLTIWLGQYSLWQNRLPQQAVLLQVMHRATMIGFLFFAIGIITGSLWAAEAWGSYWQWDPKETWALVVWLNYAAWLHYSASKRPILVLASWSMIGWGLSLFAFIGVNRWLPGLHSYAN